jgi:hypothetical protein
MTTAALASLDGLRPLREPPAPGSIAPHIVMGLMGLAAGALLVWAMSVILARRRRSRRAARAELAVSRTLPPPDRLLAQAVMLRRLARDTSGADAVRLHGLAWLERLDTIFATSFFTTGAGRVFGPDLYRPDAGPDVEALDRALAAFIETVRR